MARRNNLLAMGLVFPVALASVFPGVAAPPASAQTGGTRATAPPEALGAAPFPDAGIAVSNAAHAGVRGIAPVGRGDRTLAAAAIDRVPLSAALLQDRSATPEHRIADASPDLATVLEDVRSRTWSLGQLLAEIETIEAQDLDIPKEEAEKLIEQWFIASADLEAAVQQLLAAGGTPEPETLRVLQRYREFMGAGN